MKKICFISTVPITLNAFVLKTAEYIHNNTDWQISFICNYDKDFEANLPEYINYIPVKMERGISLSAIKVIFKLINIFKQEKFDLIQYSTPNASLYASIAGWLTRIPVRLYCQWGMVFVGFNGFKRKIFKTIEKLVCTLSTYIEPDSKSNLEFSITEKLYSKEKGTVIWNGSACGVNLEKFDFSQKEIYRKEIRKQYQLNNTDFVFGFVGRITRDKGINELFSAFKSLLANNTNARLMLVGSIENEQLLDAELLHWANNSQQVIFTGRTDVVEQYLSAMDVYILPSYREGFGMGVIEAEAMGVPVIVTEIPGPIDAMIKGKTGLAVPKKDVTALQNAMKKMMLDKPFAMECSKQAITHIQNNFEQQSFFEYVLKDRKKLLGE